MGTVSSIIFGARNIAKCANGEKTRGVVGSEQVLSAMDSVAGVLSKADGAVDSIFGKIGKSDTLEKIVTETGANSKIGAIAQKSINPLLCVAAGVRVLKDDDQYAALIEESAAMATMFGMESVMKYARAASTGGIQATTGLSGKVAGLLQSSKNISTLAEKAGAWFNNLGATTHGDTKQKLVKIGIDLLFVGGSILAYNLGHKFGEALSGRNKTESNQ